MNLAAFIVSQNQEDLNRAHAKAKVQAVQDQADRLQREKDQAWQEEQDRQAAEEAEAKKRSRRTLNYTPSSLNYRYSVNNKTDAGAGAGVGATSSSAPTATASPRATVSGALFANASTSAAASANPNPRNSFSMLTNVKSTASIDPDFGVKSIANLELINAAELENDNENENAQALSLEERALTVPSAGYTAVKVNKKLDKALGKCLQSNVDKVSELLGKQRALSQDHRLQFRRK